MPYLELQKDKEEEGEIRGSVSVPNILNMTLQEAEKTLKEIGLEVEVNSDFDQDKSKVTIIEQLPKPGITLNAGQKVIVKITQKTQEVEQTGE